MDEIIRQSYGVPEIRPEFVNHTYDILVQRAGIKSTHSARKVIRLRFGLGLAAALLLFGLIFAKMPAGQALAESIKHFFNISTTTEIPVPNPDGIVAPTHASAFQVTLLPADLAAPTDTPVPTPEGFNAFEYEACKTDPSSYTCKIAWAEKKAGFDIKEFPADPIDKKFENVYVTNGEVWIEYKRVGGGDFLRIGQGLGSQFSSMSGSVPEESIRQVMVGDYPGEFVQGLYAAGSGETVYTWKTDGSKFSLRWSDGERWYEIIQMGCVGIEHYCDAEGLIQLALSLVDQPVPANMLRADNLKSIQEAEEISGLTLLEPKMLPEEFSFHHGTFDAQLGEIKLYYSAGGYDLGAVSIILRQIPAEQFWKNSGETWQEFTGKDVTINGQDGLYQSSDGNYQSLIWQSGDMMIVLEVVSTEWYGGTITEEQVLEIAQSLE